MSEYYDIIRHEGSSSFVGNTIELVPKGFNKAVGIAAVIRLFDIPWEDTIVFGDSNNDLAMFEYAATKVAMGNASPKIKELADYVTSDMFHYGIPVSYTHLGGKLEPGKRRKIFCHEKSFRHHWIFHSCQ